MYPGDIRLVRDSPGLCVWDYPSIKYEYFDFGAADFDIIATNELIVVVKRITTLNKKAGFLNSLFSSLTKPSSDSDYYAIADRSMNLYYVSEHSLKYCTTAL